MSHKMDIRDCIAEFHSGNSTVKPACGRRESLSWRCAGGIIKIANGAGVYILVYVEVSNIVDILTKEIRLPSIA